MGILSLIPDNERAKRPNIIRRTVNNIRQFGRGALALIKIPVDAALEVPALALDAGYYATGIPNRIIDNTRNSYRKALLRVDNAAHGLQGPHFGKKHASAHDSHKGHAGHN